MCSVESGKENTSKSAFTRKINGMNYTSIFRYRGGKAKENSDSNEGFY
jgi:hypothetical protein